MVESVVYFIILFIFIATIIGLAILYASVLYSYVTDGADLRVCSITEFVVFGIIFLIEFVSMFFRGRISTFLLFGIRTYIMFSYHLLLCCRIAGYKNLFFKKRLKSLLHVIMCSLFYLGLILFIIFSFNTSFVVENDFSAFKVLNNLSIGLYDYGPKCNVLIKCIPTFYGLLCMIVMLWFDIIEKRGKSTRITDVILVVGIIISFISIIPSKILYERNVLVCFLILIPITGFYTESFNVIYHSRTFVNKSKQLKMLFNQIDLNNETKMFYYARYISKLIKNGSFSIDNIPTSKKYRNFVGLVNKFLQG